MIEELVIGAGAAAAVGFTFARRRRVRLYRNLEGRLTRVADAAPDLSALAQRELPPFDDRLATLPDALPAPAFAAIKAEAERLVAPERSFVPTHKKGGTVAYETLIAAAPAIVALYHSKVFQDFISRLVGVAVRPTPIDDQSSLSVLVYDKPGDHIGWHYDHNFYRGRHFTVLIMLANAGHAADGLSHGETRARIGGQDTNQDTQQEIAVRARPNTLTAFEGARVRHKATPVEADELRMVLSMTYCTDPRALWWQGVSRRVKDTAYFGVRALWT
jgi:2OG-Fe(II) oxygenase superfamily